MKDIRSNNREETARKEVFEVYPVILGGDPTDPKNKTFLSREQHIQTVVYWNREIRRMRAEQKKKS
jgi:hypothetical protein